MSELLFESGDVLTHLVADLLGSEQAGDEQVVADRIGEQEQSEHRACGQPGGNPAIRPRCGGPLVYRDIFGFHADSGPLDARVGYQRLVRVNKDESLAIGRHYADATVATAHTLHLQRLPQCLSTLDAGDWRFAACSA